MSKSAPPTAIERLLRNDTALLLAGPLLAAALCWAWLVPAALDMYGAMDGLSAWMMEARWDFSYGALIFAMWVVMMTGMMLPSAAPALLLYGMVCRSDSAGGSAAPRVYAFAAGYCLAWTGFSALAALLQWQLAEHELLTPMMELGNTRVASGALVLAGLYQWTAFKSACLTRCRSPASFISAHWRRGLSGALQLGLRYGLYCLGCCWALMLLLFAGGVMNLVNIVLISLLVLAEKSAPWGAGFARFCGAGLIAAGVYGLLA